MSVLNIKFTKFDNTPWGFRLAGGSDFPQPLTVIKVNEGSLGECMGLKIGDVVTALNDRPVSSLTHGQAHEALVLAGNNFTLTVLSSKNANIAIDRLHSLTILLQNLEPMQHQQDKSIDPRETVGGIQEDNIVPYTIPLDGLPPVYPEEILSAPVDEFVIEEPEEERVIEIVEEKEIVLEKPVDENSEIVPNKDITDEEIAQLILEEEELLLPDQGVLGVNFKKLRPRVPQLKQSKVLEELQKIAVEDPPRVQELRHTSTFLQKPQRPAPPSKNDLEKQASTEGDQYKVQIKKQQKKSVTERLLEKGLLGPIEVTTPEPPIEISTPSVTPVPEQQSREEDAPPSETKPEVSEEASEEGQIEECEDEPKITESIQEPEDEPAEMSCPRPPSSCPPVPTFDKAKVKELVSTEISLEKKLEEVQNQLLALKQLPSEIENHLRIVSEQLHKIMELSGVHNGDNSPGRRMSGDENTAKEDAEETARRDSPTCPSENEQDDLRSSEADTRESPATVLNDPPPTIIEPEDEDEVPETEELGEVNVKSTIEESHVKKCVASYQSKVLKSREPSPAPSHGSYEPDPNLSTQDQVIQELKYRAGRRRSTDLWPQAKQLELTYGRRWRCPNDFFNDEVIAEVLSSQAEVIRGRVMGVNFKKFEKNWLPNYDHLMGSSVYKMLHKMEREPRTGIPARPPKVNAAEDIIERVKSPALSIPEDRSTRDISH